MTIGDFLALGTLIVTSLWLAFEVIKWRKNGDR